MVFNKLFTKKLLQFLLIAVVFIAFRCSSDRSDFVHLTGNAQGTTFSIKYQSSRQKDYSKEIDSIFNVINLSMSTYHKESIISKINNGDTTIVLDKHFAKVLGQSLQIFYETNGAFDPTVGTLVNAYGFGSQKSEVTINKRTIDSLMKYVGLNKVKILNQKLVKESENIKIDFNAIAQGYTVDVIHNFLTDQNISNFMIELGGEVRTKGFNPEKKSWSIGIQNPEKTESNQLETILHLDNKSLATSGNYRKFKTDENGRKFTHTINPKTGKSFPSNLLSATVVTKLDCSLADAYATSLMVMGYEKSLEFLKNHPELEAFLIYVDTDGTTQIFSSIKE